MATQNQALSPASQEQEKGTGGPAGAGKATQFLTFMLNDEVYGIDILNIKEIINHGAIAPVPMMPEFIAGVINLRGSVVPVVNLALRFDDRPASRTRRSSIVILEVEHEEQNMEIGITVDVVTEVLDISQDDIEPAPTFGTKIRTDFINGMGKIGDQLLILLNVENMLSINELSMNRDFQNEAVC